MSSFIPFFEQLGTRAEAQWRALHFDDSRFTEVATQALTELPPAEHVTPNEIVEWLFETPHLPWQAHADGIFGDPPIQLYSSEHFYIEALFWVDGSMAIHEHAFSGAFQVLAGSSLHSTYSFTRERRVSTELELGRLQWHKSEVLERGDTRPIYFGRDTIHSLFHLDRPSVTIVMRTFRDLRTQLTYIKPGIAFAGMRELPHALLRQRTLLMLHKTDPKTFASQATRYLETADLHATVLLMLSFAGEGLSTDILGACVDIIRKRDDDFGERLETALYEALREAEVMEWRRSVLEPDLRFVLALLLNFPHRVSILQAIAHYGGALAPPAQLCAWLARLAEPMGPKPAVLALDTDDLAVLQKLLGAREVLTSAETKRVTKLQEHRALEPLFL